MTLDSYLIENAIREAEFGALVGADQSTVNRLRKGQIPGKELMAAIVEKTGGAVQPNDFFGISGAAA
jgi:hypothetical protein